MIWNILLFAFPILILVAAQCCYKKDGKRMNAFYVRMCFTDIARRLYVQLVMLLLIFFQYLQVRCFASPADIFLPLVITALLIRFAMAERLLYKLKRKKVTMVVTVIALASLFIPHLFSLAVSLSLLITAAIFYPSQKVMKLVEETDYIVKFYEHPSELTKMYY